MLKVLFDFSSVLFTDEESNLSEIEEIKPKGRKASKSSHSEGCSGDFVHEPTEPELNMFHCPKCGVWEVR